PYWDINILKTQPWIFLGYGNNNTWYDTPNFYNFTSTVVGSTVLTYSNPPEYNDTTNTDWNVSSDKNWEDLLRSNRGSIQKGDLVFYHTSTDSVPWGHVAVIVGWGLPTYWGDKADPGTGPSGMEGGEEYLAWIESLEKGCSSLDQMPLRPLVVERSGSINYFAGFRSLDNTSTKIQTIAIVHIENH
ncbi:MAG: hypothetical protein WCE68_06370, partial [Anaerolineales bacterium]